MSSEGDSMTKPISTNQVPKDTPSGFEKCRRDIEIGLGFMSGIYGVVLSMNPPVSPAAEFCPEGEDSCRRPDLFAYKITSAIAMMYMGSLGVRNWYFSQDVQNMTKKDPEDRLFGYLKAANDQNVANFCYQVWDFCFSLTIPEHREMVFLIHHVLAAITALCSLEYQMVPYYSVFYGGCSEFSSIFLVWADADQFFPPTEGSLYDFFILFCKGMFVLTFFFYRVYGWILHSFPLWKDVLHVTRTGSAEQLRPGKSSFLYLFLSLDVLLGALQLYWFGQIVQKVIEMVTQG
jgi:hypothetical protein